MALPSVHKHKLTVYEYRNSQTGVSEPLLATTAMTNVQHVNR